MVNLVRQLENEKQKMQNMDHEIGNNNRERKKKPPIQAAFGVILFLFTFLFPYFLMHLKRHHQMLDHDIVSFLAIPFFQCVIISQMFIHSSWIRPLWKGHPERLSGSGTAGAGRSG